MSEKIECEKCGDTGKVWVTNQDPRNGQGGDWEDCENCDGPNPCGKPHNNGDDEEECAECMAIILGI